MAFTHSRAAHEHRCLERARAYFVEMRGAVAATRRAADIAALPLVSWRDRPLRTLRCSADFGCGPHDVNVPEYVCWMLIALPAFRCPYH